MKDFICLNCLNYDINREWCTHYHTLIRKESKLENCMSKRPSEPIMKHQAIWWGADEDNPDVQWYLCPRCNEWFKTSIHHCKGKIMVKSKPLMEDFLTEKEMNI